MSAFIIANIAPIMFISLVIFLLSGFQSPSLLPRTVYFSPLSVSNLGF